MDTPGALRRLRLSAGLTLREAADGVGIKKTHLADIERGKHPAKTEHVRRLLALVRQHSTKTNLEELERIDFTVPVEVLCAEHAQASQAAKEAFAEIKHGADPGVWFEVAELAMSRMEAITSTLQLRLRRPE